MRAKYVGAAACSLPIRKPLKPRFPRQRNKFPLHPVRGRYELLAMSALLRLTACLLLVVSVASAHEARPAYLEIKETAPGQFSVLWRTPVLAGMRLPVVLKLPDDVKNLREPNVQELADSFRGTPVD